MREKENEGEDEEEGDEEEEEKEEEELSTKSDRRIMCKKRSKESNWLQY